MTEVNEVKKANVKVRLAEKPWEAELTKKQQKEYLLAAIQRCHEDSLIRAGDAIDLLERGAKPKDVFWTLKPALRLRDWMYELGRKLSDLDGSFNIEIYAIPWLGGPGVSPVRI